MHSLQVHPDSSQMVNIPLTMQQVEQAEAMLNKAVEDNPQSPVGHIGLVEVQILRGDSALTTNSPFTARAAYSRAIELLDAAPILAGPEAALARARALCGLGKCAEAARVLDAIPTGQHPLGFLMGAAQVRVRAGDAEAVEKLLTSLPDESTVLQLSHDCNNTSIDCQVVSGKQQAMLTTFEDASRWGQFGGGDILDHAYLPVARNHVSTWHHAWLGREVPFAAFVASGAKTPTEDVSWDQGQDLLRLYAKQDRAVQWCKDWAAAEPENYRAPDRLGEILALQGKWAEARAAFTQAADLVRQYPPDAPDPQDPLSTAAGVEYTLLRQAAAERQAGDVVAAGGLPAGRVWPERSGD